MLHYGPTSQAEEMPPLPPNAQLLVHSLPTKACSSSWGAFGWYFSTYPSAAAQYSHYIFVTAAVNGPHMPTYAQVSAWTLSSIHPPTQGVHHLEVLLSLPSKSGGHVKHMQGPA